jgi:hypothetical protein
MLNLTRLQRTTFGAATIGAVEHQIHDDKGKTGEEAGELRVAPGHDRYVEASPSYAMVSNLSYGHCRHGSRTGHGTSVSTRTVFAVTSDIAALSTRRCLVPVRATRCQPLATVSFHLFSLESFDSGDLASKVLLCLMSHPYAFSPPDVINRRMPVLVAGVLASLTELELEFGRERRAAAREARLARGQAIGRPKVLNASKAAAGAEDARDGEPARAIASTLEVSRATVYRVLAELIDDGTNRRSRWHCGRNALRPFGGRAHDLPRSRMTFPGKELDDKQCFGMLLRVPEPERRNVADSRGDTAMTNQNDEQSENARPERFDNPKLGSGVRDTGEDTPEPQPEGRPVGTVDEDANPPMSDPSASDTYGGTGELPPQDTGRAIPPYDGRKESSAVPPASTEGAGGANVGGGRGPVTDSGYKSPSPSDTPGGRSKSPADEQPASQMPESDRDDDRVGPAHVPGVGRGESKG